MHNFPTFLLMQRNLDKSKPKQPAQTFESSTRGKTGEKTDQEDFIVSLAFGCHIFIIRSGRFQRK